jgi:hypothetical protein
MLIVITRLMQRRHINQDNSTQCIAQHALVCALSEIRCTWECVATQWWGNGIGKGKSIPLQALAGPEGSRRLRLPFFKTLDTWRWLGYQPYTLSDRYAFLLDPRAIEWPGGLCKWKKFQWPHGNRTRYLWACTCTAVTQPIASQRRGLKRMTI